MQILTYKALAFGSSVPDPELDLYKKIPDMGDTDPKFLANTVHLKWKLDFGGRSASKWTKERIGAARHKLVSLSEII